MLENLAGGAAMTQETLVLDTSTDSLAFDPPSGRLVSFRTRSAPSQEFIASSPDHPAFVIQYLDEDRQYQQLDSRSAESCGASVQRSSDLTTLSLVYRRVGGMDVEAEVTVRASHSEPLARWRITVRNGASLRIVDVQFPFIVCPYDLGGLRGREALVLPHDFGMLVRAPTCDALGPDAPYAWQFTSRTGSFNHYPGGWFAQFLAYYNNRAGIFIATEDTEGRVKRFQCLHRAPGFRMGIAHVGDWPTRGERTLEYDTVLGSFTGDWYAAASRYREWSLRQQWAVPLTQRTDVPAWLLDSPVHVTIRPQGVLDVGPVAPVEEFLPYERCVPLLQRIARRVRAPLVAVIMGWERAGSWVYPDCFPPIGGEESVIRFARMCRQKGWRVGSFCNGTRWVLGHHWNGYDGRPYFREHGGDQSVSREADGRFWYENWDASWRPSIIQCMGTPLTRRIAVQFVERLLAWGLESVQFFDQNCGAATFPCFANDHGHPPAPGAWMARAMAETVAEFRLAAERAGKREAVQSVEMCCNEHDLQLFQQSDSRVHPPGHRTSAGEVIPLYQFLFHECIIMHGMMSLGPEPYHVQIANAANGVLGEIPGGVLTGNGTLLDKDTYNWGPWEPRRGDPEAGLEMIRTVSAMRRGPGRDYLVYGRMQKPGAIEGVVTVKWTLEGKRHAVPSVFHTAWVAPDGRFAVALANWTSRARRVRVRDPRLAQGATEYVVARAASKKARRVAKGYLGVSVPPLAMVLLEGGRPRHGGDRPSPEPFVTP